MQCRATRSLRRDSPFPLLSAFLENCDGCFHQEAHERRGQVPLVGVLRDDVEPVDGEEAVCGEHHANEDGARDGEAFAAHDRHDMPLLDNSDPDALVISRSLQRFFLPIKQLKME